MRPVPVRLFALSVVVWSGCSQPPTTVSPGDEMPADSGVPPFEPLERSCDGFDNDGDGTVDVSAAVDLGPKGPRSFFQWTTTPGGFAIASDRDGGLVVESFDRELNVISEHVLLPSSTTPYASPHIARFSNGVAVAWSTLANDAGMVTHWLTRILPDGGFGFTPTADGGQWAMHRAFERTFHAADAPYVVVNRDESCILYWWNDSCGGWLARAITVSPNGAPLSQPMGLLELPGAQCGIAGPVNLLPYGDSGFALFGQVKPGDSGTKQVPMTVYDCGLNEVPQPDVAVPGFSKLLVLAVNASTSTDDIWLWESSFAGLPGPLLGWRLGDGSTTEVVPSVPAPAWTVDIQNGRKGPFSVYALWDQQGTGQKVVIAHPLDGGVDRTLAVIESAPVSPAWPLVLALDEERFVVGYLEDAGAGIPQRRKARVFCAP